MTRSRKGKSRSRRVKHSRKGTSRSRKLSRRRHPSAGWKNAAPKTTSSRRALYKRCGSKCFLRPKTLGFPICSKTSRSCKPDSRGVLAAYTRARQYKHERVGRHARSIANKHRFSWASKRH